MLRFFKLIQHNPKITACVFSALALISFLIPIFVGIKTGADLIECISFALPIAVFSLYLLLVIIAVTAVSRHVVKEAEKCNYLPLLEESEIVLKADPKPAVYIQNAVNRANALLSMGDAERCKAQLDTINIDGVKLSPLVKFAFYYISGYCSLAFHDNEKALSAFQKVFETAREHNAIRTTKDITIRICEADVALINGNAEEAYSKILSIPESVQCEDTRICIMLTKAKALLALGKETEAAALLTEISNTNHDIANVNEARSLLQALRQQKI